jgi:hypothetical protein
MSVSLLLRRVGAGDASQELPASACTMPNGAPAAQGDIDGAYTTCMRTFLGMSLLLLACAAALAGCIPRPDDPAEWVAQPDAVIVQMKTVYPGVDVSNMVPDLTLYGDGALIMRNDEGGLPYRLFDAKLSTGEVRSLLKFVNGTGFFNFNYEQPEPERTTDRPTTYLYVQTKEAANAVSAYALDSVLPDDAGKEWAQFRKAQEIKSRLDEIAREAMANGPSYTPEAILITVERPPPISVEQILPQWPFSDIDLDALAPESGTAERRIEGAAAREVLDRMSPINGGSFLQGGQRFQVALRPLLPYEEHFPEFEPPQ